MTQSPLNFLIIMSDEHRRDAMGCMGHRHVKTPHLDALASRGVVAERYVLCGLLCRGTVYSCDAGAGDYRAGCSGRPA